MKISEKLKHLFRRKPRTMEQLAARAEADVRRAQAEGDATASANNASAANMAGPYSGL